MGNPSALGEGYRYDSRTFPYFLAARTRGQTLNVEAFSQQTVDRPFARPGRITTSARPIAAASRSRVN